MKVFDLLKLYRADEILQKNIQIRQQDELVKEVTYYRLDALYVEPFLDEEIENWYIQSESLIINLKEKKYRNINKKATHED